MSGGCSGSPWSFLHAGRLPARRSASPRPGSAPRPATQPRWLHEVAHLVGHETGPGEHAPCRPGTGGTGSASPTGMSARSASALRCTDRRPRDQARTRLASACRRPGTARTGGRRRRRRVRRRPGVPDPAAGRRRAASRYQGRWRCRSRCGTGTARGTPSAGTPRVRAGTPGAVVEQLFAERLVLQRPAVREHPDDPARGGTLRA